MIYDSLEFEIHYTNKDRDYIKDVINGLEDKYREIMDFFGIRHFKKKLIINTIHVYEYDAPKKGCSNQEFLDNVFDNGKEIVIKKR